EATVEHDESKRVGYLTDLFIRIHRDIFQDWKQQNAGRPGDIADAEKRDALRKAVLNVLCANGSDENGMPGGLFDANGYVIHREPKEVAGILARFSNAIQRIHPFDYGNEL